MLEAGCGGGRNVGCGDGGTEFRSGAIAVYEASNAGNDSKS